MFQCVFHGGPDHGRMSQYGLLWCGGRQKIRFDQNLAPRGHAISTETNQHGTYLGFQGFVKVRGFSYQNDRHGLNNLFPGFRQTP